MSFTVVAHAQEEVFQRGIEFGIGARALGMGGAYIGISDDYSATYWNPAALTQIRRIEGFGTMSYTQFKDNVTSSSVALTDEETYTRFNSLGLAYPIPTYRGSLVLSLGYNRVRPYDSNFGYSWFNATPGDSVGQRWSEVEEGGLNNWAFAVATEIAPNFSVGGALNIWSGKNEYQFSFIERDELNVYTFDDFRSDETIESDFSGYNVKLAAMYHPSSLLRLGLTLATPTTLTVEEQWRTYEETNDDNGDQFPAEETGKFKYKISSPIAIGGGASVSVAGLLLSGSAEYNDWSNVRYKSEPPITGLSESEANDRIRRQYRETLRLHLGAEFTLPVINLQVRGGYIYDPTILSKEAFQEFYNMNEIPQNANRQFLTGGLGIFLDKQVRLDLAVMAGEWHEYKAPLYDMGDGQGNDIDVIPVSEKVRVNKALATIAFRF
jgi:long-subunit fatty acid transport protein